MAAVAAPMAAVAAMGAAPGAWREVPAAAAARMFCWALLRSCWRNQRPLNYTALPQQWASALQRPSPRCCTCRLTLRLAACPLLAGTTLAAAMAAAVADTEVAALVAAALAAAATGKPALRSFCRQPVLWGSELLVTTPGLQQREVQGLETGMAPRMATATSSAAAAWQACLPRSPARLPPSSRTLVSPCRDGINFTALPKEDFSNLPKFEKVCAGALVCVRVGRGGVP